MSNPNDYGNNANAQLDREFGWVCLNGTVTPYFVRGNVALMIQQKLLRKFLLILHPGVERDEGTYYCFQLYHVTDSQALFLNIIANEETARRVRVSRLDDLCQTFRFLETYFSRLFQQSLITVQPEPVLRVPTKPPSFCMWCAVHTGSGLSCQCGRVGPVLPNVEPVPPTPAANISMNVGPSPAPMQVGFLPRLNINGPPREEIPMMETLFQSHSQSQSQSESQSQHRMSGECKFGAIGDPPTPQSCWNNPMFQELLRQLNNPSIYEAAFSRSSTNASANNFPFDQNYGQYIPVYVPPYMPSYMSTSTPLGTPSYIPPSMPPMEPSEVEPLFGSFNPNTTPIITPFDSINPYLPSGQYIQVDGNLQQIPSTIVVPPLSPEPSPPPPPQQSPQQCANNFQTIDTEDSSTTDENSMPSHLRDPTAYKRFKRDFPCLNKKKHNKK